MIIHQPWNSIGNYTYNAFFYTKRTFTSHFHRNYELMYVERGSIETVINGEAVVLYEHEYLLISPFTIHSFIVDERSRVWVSVFSEDFIYAFAEKSGNVRYSKFVCSPSSDSFLRDNLLIEGQPELFLTKACLYLVVSECQRNAIAYNIKNELDFRSRLINYISENLAYDITLSDAAITLNYEYHYCSSLFHRCFGVNFKEFVNIFRFEEACKMLADTSEDIVSIANACGFKSVRNFNRVFKKMADITPTEYRKRKV